MAPELSSRPDQLRPRRGAGLLRSRRGPPGVAGNSLDISAQTAGDDRAGGVSLRILGLQDLPDPPLQVRNLRLNAVPDDRNVNAEIAVRHTVAHQVNVAKGDFAVPGRERRVQRLDIPGRLTHDLNIPNYRILDQQIAREILSAHALRVTGNTCDGFKDVPEKYRRSRWVVLHTGAASASTRLRYDSGRLRGVRTSTEIP